MSNLKVKEPSKKFQANIIFLDELDRRSEGLFPTNKAFRKVVLSRMVEEIGVSEASASSMYNESKKAAMIINPTLNIGRDPKQIKE